MEGCTVAAAEAFKPDFAAVEVDDIADNKQSETAAANCFSRITNPLKNPEQFFLKTAGDTMTPVGKAKVSHLAILT